MNKQDMIKSVRNYLSRFGPVDEKILKAIEKIDRRNFMSKRFARQAYLDTAMPIEKGQTISQPSTVARMLSLLKLKKGDSVLEIGTGSGWNAALLAFLVNPGTVLSLEIHKELADSARKKIKKLKIQNLQIEDKDFLKLKSKFDKIILTAGILEEQEKMIVKCVEKNLKENGILVCPFQEGPLIIIRKLKKNIKVDRTSEEYAFVPLLE